MYAKTLVRCPECGQEQWVDSRDLDHYDIGCSCGGTMDPTGCEEYDEEGGEMMEQRYNSPSSPYYRSYRR